MMVVIMKGGYDVQRALGLEKNKLRDNRIALRVHHKVNQRKSSGMWH